MRFSFYFAICLLLFTNIINYANDTIKKIIVKRINEPINIDGKKDDLWNKVPKYKGFKQTNPYFNAKPLYDTEFQLAYDNYALYVLAYCIDNHPDSILQQLGMRDNRGLNADYFSISIDTYNKQQDAYVFGVFSSGVQFDSRYSDGSYNAVWKSAVQITDSGWVVEMAIPYSAFRFPKNDIQEWRFQATRYIRRIRQESQFVAISPEVSTPLMYWAKLENINNITPPIRLSFTPYFSTGIQFENTTNSKIFGGGLDLKLGINESHTLDLTLLPDFTQVQSDNKYKNLSAFETIYDEQRPFFKESVDLFNKGDIFYSRRIGRTPRYFYSIINMIDSNEFIVKNPSQTQLLNAFKIYGRNYKGTALGVLNAITNDTYAEIKNKITGETRRINTEPMANYNVLIFDQAFRNSNNIYITNTSFLRNKYYSSNVITTGLSLYNPSNTYQLSLSGGMSHFYNFDKNEYHFKDGYKTAISINKVSGKLRYGASARYMDKHFNANDVGVTMYNNYLSHNVYINYNQFQPVKVFLNYGININYSQSYYLSTMKITQSVINCNFWSTTHNYTSIWLGSAVDLYNPYDYYEPRVSGYSFRRGKYQQANIGFSTDYRKPLAVDISSSYSYCKKFKTHVVDFEFSPLARINNHWSFRYTFNINNLIHDFGFATIENNTPLFGQRKVKSITNSFTSSYILKNDLSLSLKLRHYWSQGDYSIFYILNEQGELNYTHRPDLINNFDFNYNAFTIDLIFSWQFGPGSNLLFVWKNEILNEQNNLIHSYLDNLNNIVQLPQTNTLLLKVLYYIDYQNIMKYKNKA